MTVLNSPGRDARADDARDRTSPCNRPHANRILVLRDGRIEEQGTFDELVVRGGFFAYLHDLQKSAKLADAQLF